MAVWRSQGWLRKLISAALVLLVVVVVIAYFGIVNVPVISRMVYHPVEPVRRVLATKATPSLDVFDGQRVLTEGQLTALLQQLKHIPGSATLFYDLQAVVESGRVEIYGSLFQSGGYYRFTAHAEPAVNNGRLEFTTKDLHVQKIGLPASYVQPLFNQLAAACNVTLLNATVRQITTQTGQINLISEPASIR